MIRDGNRIYNDLTDWFSNNPARCRNGMCPDYNIATEISWTDDTATPICKKCSEQKAMTGSFPITREENNGNANA